MSLPLARRFTDSFPALRHRDFTLLWIGQLLSFAGSRMQTAAILWAEWRRGRRARPPQGDARHPDRHGAARRRAHPRGAARGLADLPAGGVVLGRGLLRRPR